MVARALAASLRRSQKLVEKKDCSSDSGALWASNQGQTGGGMPSYTGALGWLETNILSIGFNNSRWDSVDPLQGTL